MKSMGRFNSCVVGRGCLLWPVHSLGRALLAFALLHFILQVLILLYSKCPSCLLPTSTEALRRCWSHYPQLRISILLKIPTVRSLYVLREYRELENFKHDSGTATELRGSWCLIMIFCLHWTRSLIYTPFAAAAAAKSLQSCPTLRPHRRQHTLYALVNHHSSPPFQTSCTNNLLTHSALSMLIYRRTLKEKDILSPSSVSVPGTTVAYSVSIPTPCSSSFHLDKNWNLIKVIMDS